MGLPVLPLLTERPALAPCWRQKGKERQPVHFHVSCPWGPVSLAEDGRWSQGSREPVGSCSLPDSWDFDSSGRRSTSGNHGSQNWFILWDDVGDDNVVESLCQPLASTKIPNHDSL